MKQPLESLRGALIVSCQARDSEPLAGADLMASMALAAELAGARGVRINGPATIRKVKALVRVPVVGLLKDWHSPGGRVITPSFEHAEAIRKAGADLIAIDSTLVGRTETDLASFVKQIHLELECPVWGDIACFEDGPIAERCGIDVVATTLCLESKKRAAKAALHQPDLAVVEALAGSLSIPVVAEGAITEPSQAREALERGAFAVVVGSAITRPGFITRRFLDAMESESS